MSIEKFDYCNFDFSLMKEVLESAFLINDFETIKKSYEKFTIEFYRNDSIKPETLARKNFMPLTCDQVFLDKFQNTDYTVGVDLPVIIGNKEKSNGKCIFIIGEDPLRDERKFITQSQDLDVVLSTPFGTHHTPYRDFKGKIYWEFSLWLLAKGYRIYYTDIKKIWIKKRSEKMKVPIPIDLYKNFEKCLNTEIGEFNPEMLITFGKDAKNAISKITMIKKLEFIHPTFAASKHWKTRYNLASASNEKKFEKMTEEFEKAIIKKS